MVADLKEMLRAAITEFNERRRYPRYQKQQHARYRIFTFEETPERGRTREIGADGMCFVTSRALPKNGLITAEIDVPDFGPLVLAIGMVLDSRPAGGGKFENELQFVWLGQEPRPSDADSIDSLVHRLTPEVPQSILDD